MVATPMQIFINILDVYFGKSELFCGVHLKMVFELTLVLFNLTFGHSLFLREFFACMRLEILGQLTYSECKVASYYGLHISAREFVEVIT